MIESQLELVKKEEWDDLLQPPTSEQPDIETIKEVKKELEDRQNEDQVDEVEETEELDGYEEGMTPAVELPEVK